MPTPTKPTRSFALSILKRDTLAKLTSKYRLEVKDGRSPRAHAEALGEAEGISFAEVLLALSRDDLKRICSHMEIDDSGKEKGLIAERIAAAVDGTSKRGGKVAEKKSAADADGGFELKSPEPKAKKTRAPAEPRSVGGEPTGDYRHDATRKNNPPAGLIDLDKPPPQPKKTYSYDPHLDPQLQWSGKAEHTSFDVDTVSLHIHERISAQAIMRAVKREDAQRSLFGGDDLPESKAIDFYAHDVGWANRLCLGDSLLVMNSLLEREQMAGKVQCVFIDPPYGVKFNSNFQPLISRREVKDGDDRSLTREPEQIQAYRDTWTLGVHSYLTYLRDRLLLSRELLAVTGSAFVQISEDNLHHARELMDEVFGADNFVTIISFAKTSGTTSKFIPTSNDYIIWYAKDLPNAKYRQLYSEKSLMAGGGTAYGKVRLADGSRRPLAPGERANPDLLPAGARVYRLDNVTSQSTGRDKGEGAACWFSITVEGKAFTPGERATWKTNEAGMARLLASGRLESTGTGAYYVRYLDDFTAYPLSNVWGDTGIAGFASDKRYVVETATKAIERCILMVTDPGDLVLDPTCGSGTTAFVAEQWGRRWVTCDTSRVALSLARQRLLTAKFPYFRLRSDKVKDGFDYRAVPHVTLKSIAQNPKLDECRTQEERDRAIRQSADKETLYDQPEEDRGKVRVSGPFTVEAIPVASMEDVSEAAASLDPDARQDDIARTGRGDSAIEAGTSYVGYMIDLLRKSGGVHFKNGKTLPLTDLRSVKTAFEWLHAESATGFEGDDPRKVAVSFGPRHAPVTPKQVFDTIRETRGYDIVLFVGFACDPEALGMIEKGTSDRIFQFVHAAPDILVGDLLKTTKKTTKLFTVFGLPDVKVKKEKDGQVTATLTGVDIYDPTTGETTHDDGENVAAWFLDHDYDGRTFCVCQAFFPGGKAKNPWEKLQKALKGSIDEEKFESLRGTTSIPFKPGKKVAVKVIDDRGNEVVKVVNA